MSEVHYVTGAGSGIGLEIATRFARQGKHLALFDLQFNDEAKRQLLRNASGKRQMFEFCEVDVSKHQDLENAVASAGDKLGAPTLVLHCAGINLTGPFEQMPEGAFEKVVSVNLFGTKHLLSAVLPLLKRQATASRKKVKLILVASMAGLVGNYGYTSYCASKFGVVGLAQSLRLELAPAGIQVQVISPPEVDTPMVHKEHLSIHPVTLKLKLLAGSLSLPEAVDGIMRGMQKNRFVIIPGAQAKLTYWLGRLVPQFLMHRILDRMVQKTLREL